MLCCEGAQGPRFNLFSQLVLALAHRLQHACSCSCSHASTSSHSLLLLLLTGATINVASFETSYIPSGGDGTAPAPQVFCSRLSSQQSLLTIEGMFVHPSTDKRIFKACASCYMGHVFARVSSMSIADFGGCAICGEGYKLVLQVNGHVESIELDHDECHPVWSYEGQDTGEVGSGGRGS